MAASQEEQKVSIYEKLEKRLYDEQKEMAFSSIPEIDEEDRTLDEEDERHGLRAFQSAYLEDDLAVIPEDLQE